MTKQQIIEALQKLPEDATFEDAIERLYFLQKLEQRLALADAGHTISHEEAKKRIAKWLK